MIILIPGEGGSVLGINWAALLDSSGGSLPVLLGVVVLVVVVVVVSTARRALNGFVDGLSREAGRDSYSQILRYLQARRKR